MHDWKTRLDLEHPCWSGYRVLIRRLPAAHFPTPRDLDRLLLPGQANAAGKPIRFRPAAELAGVAYEKHIYETGEVSTRENNWHDLFNALVWCRFPRLKAAMNAVHYRHLDEANDGRRGPRRDALTLLDESGVIVITAESRLVDALRARDWRAAFLECREDWLGTGVMVCGHAILEKFLAPYKALTAHALLVTLPAPECAADLDQRLARLVAEEKGLRAPADLSALPLMGVPGWWPEGPQDDAFYADRQVFRPPPGKNAKLAPPI